MSTQPIDPAPDPAVYKEALTFTVPSASKAHETHLIDLDTYGMNGKCDCMHFATRLEPLLARGITPEQAVASGAIKLKPGQRPENALRCKHIVEAYFQFAESAARAIHHAKKANTPQDPPPF